MHQVSDSESVRAEVLLKAMGLIEPEEPPIHPRLQKMVHRARARIRRASIPVILAKKASRRSKAAAQAYAHVEPKAQEKKMHMRHQAKKLEGK